jgi:hypothetical protein
MVWMMSQARGDDGTTASGTTWVDGVMGSGMHGVHSVIGSRRTMSLQAREWRRRLLDDGYVVDGVTDSGQGRWRHVNGLDRGQE